MSARADLCGGRSAMIVPTATMPMHILSLKICWRRDLFQDPRCTKSSLNLFKDTYFSPRPFRCTKPILWEITRHRRELQ